MFQVGMEENQAFPPYSIPLSPREENQAFPFP